MESYTSHSQQQADSVDVDSGQCPVWCWMWIIEVAGGIEDWCLLSAGGQHLLSVQCTGLGQGGHRLVPHLQFITSAVHD